MSAGPSKVYFTVLQNWLRPQGLSNNYLQELMKDKQVPQGQTSTSRTNTIPMPNKKGGGNCKIV